MAKRFIDTGIFDDEWFAELNQDCKLFWVYYITKCDHAGLLKFNKKLIEFQTGIKSLETVIEQFGNRLIRVKEELLFCPKFISFQYPGFPKSGVKQQEGAISLLIKAGLWDQKTNSYLTLSEVLPKTYESDNDNVIGNGNDNGSVKKQIENFIFNNESFMNDLKLTNKGKDLKKAWEQCWLHFSQLPNGLHDWEWKQKYAAWVARMKPEKNGKDVNGKTQLVQ